MFVRRAMRGNHDAGCWRGDVGRLFANALSAKLFADDRVVHQFTQNGEGGFPGEGLRLRDGIANAETDPKMFRNDDLHLLCVTKLRDKFFIFSRLSQFAPTPADTPERLSAPSPSGRSSFADDPEFPSSPPPIRVCAKSADA